MQSNVWWYFCLVASLAMNFLLYESFWHKKEESTYSLFLLFLFNLYDDILYDKTITHIIAPWTSSFQWGCLKCITWLPPRPLSEHSIPPETLRGQWPPLQEHSNKAVAFNTPFRSLLSSSYKEWKQLGRFHQISDTFLTSRTIYLPIIGILSLHSNTHHHRNSSDFFTD